MHHLDGFLYSTTEEDLIEYEALKQLVTLIGIEETQRQAVGGLLSI